MEIHQRIINLPTLELLLISKNYPNIIEELTFLVKLKIKFFTLIKNEVALNTGHLILYRKILCQEYQMKVKNKENSDLFKVPNLSRPNLIDLRAQDDADFCIVYDIIILELVLSDNELTLIAEFKNFRTKNNTDWTRDQKTRTRYMKTIECFLDSWALLCFYKTLRNIDYRKFNEASRSLYNYTSGEFLTSFIITDLKEWLVAKTESEWCHLVSILPKVVELSESTEVLQPIWAYINFDINDLKAKITAMCMVVDVAFPLKSSEVEYVTYDMCFDQLMWTSIMAGLMSFTQSIRKDALFLLKRISEFIDENETEIKESNAFKQKKFNPFICSQSNSASIKGIRRNFILLMEALQEKQRHLIIPSLSLLQSILDGNKSHMDCGNCFDLCWILCFFANTFHHDNDLIVRWGLIQSFKLDNAVFDLKFLALVIPALNHTFLYESHDENEPDIVLELCNLFSSAEKQNFDLICRVVFVLSEVAWGPIAIYYILKALSGTVDHTSVTKYWDRTQLTEIKKLVESNLVLHGKPLRFECEANLLTAITHFVKDQDLLFLTKFFTSFSQKHIVKNQKTWARLVAWIKRITSQERAIKYVSQVCKFLLTNDNSSLNMSSFALMIHLLFDADLIQVTNTCPAGIELAKLLQNLSGIDVRPYADITLTTRLIELVFCTQDYPRECPKFVQCVMKYGFSMHQFLIKSLGRADLKLEEVKTYIRALRRLNYSASMNDPKLQAKCLSVFQNAQTYDGTLLYVAQFLKYGATDTEQFITNNIISILNTLTLKDSDENCQTSDKNRNIASEYFITILDILATHFSYIKDNAKEDIDWIEKTSFFLDVFGNDAVPAVATMLKTILCPECLDCDKMKGFVNVMVRCYDCNFRSRKNKQFWIAAQALTTNFLDDQFLKYDSIRECSATFIRRMLDEGGSSPGLKYMLLRDAYKPEYFALYMEVILDCLLHGSILRRDQKICMQAYKSARNEFVMNSSNPTTVEIINSQYNLDSLIRATAVKCFWAACERSKNALLLFLTLTLEKLDLIKGKRYYADSQVHRFKHRIMQVLLLLQPHLNEDETIILHDYVCHMMLTDSDQHSVRIMEEWLLIRIYLSRISPGLLEKELWEFFKTVYDKRPASASVVIGIMYHVVRLSGSQALIKRALTALGPCCMGQQFNMRLYAQVIFAKLYGLLENNSMKLEYKFCYESALVSLQSGNLKKNSNKMKDDFYIMSFHPIEHYSIETIFYTLPRLCNVGNDEWIEVSKFTEDKSVELPQSIPIVNPHFSLLKETMPSYMSKPARTEEIEIDNAAGDIQKKIIPWRQMLPNEEELAQLSRPKDSDTRNLADGLIVVASLINRPQNLGGIARTCEIFGVKELVLANLALVEDKEFQVLSVSAEKWIKITEVKPFLLPKYFAEMKASGWSLIGAEQTANSVNLLHAEFPKKTLLILGNEKDGIPPNLIPLMDTCIEVPQVGVIRSLNVHVTTAICVWEYMKQLQ